METSSINKDTVEYVWPGMKKKVSVWKSGYYAPPYLDMDDVHQEAYIALVQAHETLIYLYLF